MFVACPHCGYLVALIVANDGPPRACPRCGGALQGKSDDAGDTTTAPSVSVSVPAKVAQTASAPRKSAPAIATSRASELRKAGTVASVRPIPHGGADAADAADAAKSGVTAAGTATATREHARSEGPAAIEPSGTTSVKAAPVGIAQTDAAATQTTPTHAEAASDTTDQAPNETPALPLPPLTAETAPVARRSRRAAPRNGKPETAVSATRRAPSFARQQARTRAAAPRLHWSLAALAVALALLLGLQLLLAQRDELAADAGWRPTVAALCGALPCEIPPWREPSALTMLNRNVLPVADRTGVLRVSAGFRNDARWAQPWPTLVLSLEDVDGRKVGQRAFSPKDYRKGYKAGELIAPGQSAAVQFDVLEPAPHVVAFTFDFR
ncbi:DUF3426 domain-containing protein [Lysobacter sp. CA199]|uniref:DUF3426 domain-containing protein n=1 Tax=Lysobacter sp. CA199 TaxID=3455608 RepID=UPI003F8D3677